MILPTKLRVQRTQTLDMRDVKGDSQGLAAESAQFRQSASKYLEQFALQRRREQSMVTQTQSKC